MYESVVDDILRDILDAIPEGVYVTTDAREIVYWNEAAAHITGYTAEDIVGARCCDDVLVHQDAEGNRLCDDDTCPLTATLAHGEPLTDVEMYLKRDDGERLGVSVTTRRLRVGDQTFAVELFREMTPVGSRALASAIQQLSDSSVTDPLTGLLNRDYLDALLEQQFALFRRVGLHFAITRVDIDDMGGVNDTYGSATGDEILVFVAEILANNTRKMDTLTRFGDDEFAIISPIRGTVGAEEIGKRVLGLIRGSEFTTGSEEVVPLRVSVGAAVAQTEDQTAGDIVARAGRVLDEIRDSGGDGFRFAAF